MTGATNANGQLTGVYLASNTLGVCTITAMEGRAGYSSSASIVQVAPGNAVVGSANPPNLAANGVGASVVTITVTSFSGAPVVGDPVIFSLGGPNPPGACGRLLPSTVPTNASGQAIATYTSSTTPGACSILAIETDTGDGISFGIGQN
jgi:hypothetical protein